MRAQGTSAALGIGMTSAARFTTGPRERLAEVGIDALGDAELIALLLGTGHTDEPVEILALRLLEELGGLEGLTRAGAGELAVRRGVGLAKGARIAAANSRFSSIVRCSSKASSCGIWAM